MFAFKKLTIAGIVAAGLTFVGCLTNEETVPAALEGQLKISTTVDGVNLSGTGGLSKANLISLQKLIIIMTSNAASPTSSDTVRDTITAGSQGFSATSTAQQTVTKSYTVKGLRTWTVTASVRDSKDSLTHSAVTVVTPSFVKVADTASASLNLTSRFSMYEVNFASLPATITTSAGTGHTQAVTYKRILVTVGGITVKDTSAAAIAAQAYSWSYDYIPVGSHVVRLVAFGTTGETYNDTLFSGVTTINSTAGNDQTVSLNLDWKGPNLGTEKVAVTIGKVGKTTVNGGNYCGAGCVPKR